MNNQVSFRNSLAAKLFLQRIDDSQFKHLDYETLANESLYAAQDFVETAIEFQDQLDATEESEESGCGSCNLCDDEGYMASRPGETFGAFLKRIYADRDTAMAKAEAEKKHDEIHKAGKTNIEFTSLKDLFEQLKAELETRNGIKD